MTVVGIIPARLLSSRLPRKLLLSQTGKPLIQYVWEAANRSRSLDDVCVATDSVEIARTVREFGGRAELTGDHPSGTDRVADIARRSFDDAEILVNLQGDEPELDPQHIDRLVDSLRENPDDEMSTLATPFTNAEDVRNPNCVKVVRGVDGRALYFSRSAIPFTRDREIDDHFDSAKRQADAARMSAKENPALNPSPCHPLNSQLSTLNPQPFLLHVGLYAYRREFLFEVTQRPPSPLEQLEKLEQLRALEAAATIRVQIVPEACVGIDTPEDYAAFVQRQSSLIQSPWLKTA